MKVVIQPDNADVLQRFSADSVRLQGARVPVSVLVNMILRDYFANHRELLTTPAENRHKPKENAGNPQIR